MLGRIAADGEGLLVPANGGDCRLKKPPGVTEYAIVVVLLITVFITWIAARTVVLAARGRLFPQPD